MYTETLTYSQIKKELDQWCDEYGIYSSDDMYYPFSAHGSEKMSIIQVMWRMHQEGRVNTMRGMQMYFDRYVAHKHLQPVEAW